MQLGCCWPSRHVARCPCRHQSAEARYTVQWGEAKAAKNSNGHAGWNPGQPYQGTRTTCAAPQPLNMKGSLMSDFKKGQKVTARTLRGTRQIKGTVANISGGAKGAWIEVQPDEKDEKSFKTRPACVKAA